MKGEHVGSVELALDRATFLDLLTAGVTTSVPSHAALVADLQRAVGTVSITADPGSDETVMWVGPSHTVIATGDSQMTLRRIRSANTALAVIHLLRAREDRESRWWRVRVEGAEVRTIELFDGGAPMLWMVDEGSASTRVAPSPMSSVVARLCDAIELFVAPI